MCKSGFAKTSFEISDPKTVNRNCIFACIVRRDAASVLPFGTFIFAVRSKGPGRSRLSTRLYVFLFWCACVIYAYVRSCTNMFQLC